MEVPFSAKTRASEQTVSSLKYHSAYDGFKKYNRKQKQPIQLQSFMSQLIVDNPVVFQAVHQQQLDHFQRLKKLNQMHQLDIGYTTLEADKQNTQILPQRVVTSTKTIRPYSSLHGSYKTKQFASKMKQEAVSFNRTLKSQDRSKNIKLKKSDILHDIQQRSAACLHKFIQNNEKKEVFNYVDQLLKEVQNKSKNDLSNLLMRCSKLEQQKSNLQRQILEINYRMRSLERTNQQQSSKINQVLSQSHHIESKYRSLAKFSQDYDAIQQFQPGTNCRELIANYKKMQELCLNKLNLTDDSKLRASQNQVNRLQDQLTAFKLRFQIVNKNMIGMQQQLKQRRQSQREQDDNFRKLTISQKQLKQLQNRIVQFYNNWYQNRKQTIKGILKQIGCFKDDYSYMQMIDYMELDLSNLSTSSKVDQYLRKIVATIQLAQRKIFPDNVSSTKIDPCKVINEIVSYALSINVGGNKRQQKQTKKLEHTYDNFNDDLKYLTEV